MRPASSRRSASNSGFREALRPNAGLAPPASRIRTSACQYASVGDEHTPGRGERLSDLSALYREHHAYVARVLRHLGLDAALVDDAVQEVFLVVHRRLASFDPSRSLRNWLFGISRRIASDYRRGTRKGSRPLVLVADPNGSMPSHDNGTRMESARLVEQFLATLDDDKRTVFLLAEVEGMTAPEIAEVLRLNVNTVYARLRAARLAFERTIAAAEPRRAPWTG